MLSILEQDPEIKPVVEEAKSAFKYSATKNAMLVLNFVDQARSQMGPCTHMYLERARNELKFISDSKERKRASKLVEHATDALSKLEKEMQGYRLRF